MTLLKPDTYYWIKAHDKKQRNALQMCKTEDWITTHGFGFYIFGSNQLEYAKDYTDDAYQFVEVTRP